MSAGGTARAKTSKAPASTHPSGKARRDDPAKERKPADSRGKTTLIGYARVSTDDQQTQVAALKKAGVREGNLFVEKISSRR